MFRTPWLVVTLLFCGLGVRGGQALADDRRFEPTENYEIQNVAGWVVLVNKGLLTNAGELASRTLSRLENQLRQIEAMIPPAALEKLRRVRIWVEEAEPNHECMAYHPDPGWLRDHAMNPEKARCVEIANARNFLDWTRHQPWMVFHELAHAYHHQFLPEGFGNKQVESAYRMAMKEARYAKVLRFDGREVNSYAETNPMEYFAECSEAYFGTNDFFPFVRAELRRHDPNMFEVLGEVWEEKKNQHEVGER